MSATHLSDHYDQVKPNTGLVVLPGGLKSIKQQSHADGNGGSKINAASQPQANRKHPSTKRTIVAFNKNPSPNLPFDDLRKQVGEHVLRQWESRARSKIAFGVLCMLATYGLHCRHNRPVPPNFGFSMKIPHDLLVFDATRARRGLRQHLANLEEDGLLWRSPDWRRCGIRLRFATPKPTSSPPEKRPGVVYGIYAASLWHQRQRSRKRRSLPPVPGSASWEEDVHPPVYSGDIPPRDSIPLAVAQSAKADFERLQRRTPVWLFNRPALRDVLDKLEITYYDGLKNFSMRCFASPRCAGHRRPTLYLAHSTVKAGIWHCFRCNERGYVDELVRIKTGWDRQNIVAFLKEHQAYEDPETIRDAPRPVAPIDLHRFIGQRHTYLSEKRRLTDATLDRFDIGYDAKQSVVIIPVYDTQHNLVGYKERWIGYRRYNEVALTSDRAFFGIDKVMPRSIVWICEGEFDAMHVDQCLRDAFPHHSAIALGGKYLGEKKLSALIALQPVMFVDALDNDAAGLKASTDIRKLLEQIAPVMRMQYEDFTVKDPNDSSPRQLARQAYRANEYLYSKAARKRAPLERHCSHSRGAEPQSKLPQSR